MRSITKTKLLKPKYLVLPEVQLLIQLHLAIFFTVFNIDFKSYSENWIPRAAQLIFLNKACYNGLFRFNSSGEFNSPFGKYKNPRILDKINLISVSNILQIAEIKKADFREINKDIVELFNELFLSFV